MNRSKEKIEKTDSSYFSQSHHFFCNNCGKYGNHTYNNCKFPTTSIGLIVIRNQNTTTTTTTTTTTPSYEFLMIRRKDTLGFVDFIRGKYTFSNIIHVRNIIDEMTIDEKNRLLNCDFKQLWGEMWGSYTNGQFSGEEAQSREKFNKIKNGVFFKGCNGESKVITLRHLIETSSTHWKHAEWGFPKGRRNNQESDIDCALRENLEETGYAIKKSDVLSNIVPFEEVFVGSNLKSYKHKYFVAMIHANDGPVSTFEQSEVSKLKWLSYDDCVKKIRPYNIEKTKMLQKLHSILTTFCVIKSNSES